MDTENHSLVAQLPSPEDLPVSVPLAVHDRDAMIVDVWRRIGRIEANTEATAEAVHGHESRIRTLEERQWSIPGLSVLISLLSIFGFHH